MECIKTKKPTRAHSGEVWRTNSSNKRRLVIDFENKCGYCDDHDKYSGGYNSYHVEHFAPKEKYQHLEFTYENLLYCCPYCNISKSDKWVGSNATESIVGDRGFVDPCTDEYYLHLRRDNLGNIEYTTSIGKYMYEELKLYLNRHSILYNLEKVRLKKKLLCAKIDEKRLKQEDTVILEETYKELCIVFCEYFDLLFDSYD